MSQYKKETDKKKKRKSAFEAEIFSLLQKSLKAALDMAMEDLFKDWK